MNNIDREKHKKTKRVLRILGISLMVVGLVLAIIGFVDFFSSMNGDEMPKLFFLCFIGLPMAVIGFMLITLGFKKEIDTYMKNESVPVMNEMGEELHPAISSITKAVKDGLDEEGIQCECGEVNDKGSKFCSACGKPLARKCPSCGADVESDDKFCSNCGQKLED